MKRKQEVYTNMNIISGASEISSIIWHCYFFLLTKFPASAYRGADGMNYSPRNNIGGLSHLNASKAKIFFSNSFRG